MTDPALLDELGDYVSGVAGIDPEVRDQIIYRIAGVKRSGIPLPGRFDCDLIRQTLEFYADPFAWKKKHDPEDVLRIPDFYSETSFGDTALETLATLALPRAVQGVTIEQCAQVAEKRSGYVSCDPVFERGYYAGRELAAKEIRALSPNTGDGVATIEQAKAYVEKAIASYAGDPSDNNFQEGFLAALEVVRDEAFTTSALPRSES